MKKWDKGKGGYIQTKGPDCLVHRSYDEHKKRWNDTLNEMLDERPDSMGFRMSEVVKRFNRGAKAQGYVRARLVRGELELG